MRRALLAVVVLLAVAPAVASAQGRKASRMHEIRVAVAATFGPDICGDTMNMPIVRRDLGTDAPTGIDVGASMTWTGEVDGIAQNCLMRIDDRPWSTYHLCEVVFHEAHHALTLTTGHSPNPRSLMYWAGPSGFYLPCADFRT